MYHQDTIHISSKSNYHVTNTYMNVYCMNQLCVWMYKNEITTNNQRKKCRWIQLIIWIFMFYSIQSRLVIRKIRWWWRWSSSSWCRRLYYTVWYIFYGTPSFSLSTWHNQHFSFLLLVLYYILLLCLIHLLLLLVVVHLKSNDFLIRW